MAHNSLTCNHHRTVIQENIEITGPNQKIEEKKAFLSLNFTWIILVSS